MNFLRVSMWLLMLLGLWAPSSAASADTFPSRRLTIVVPYQPGGSTDILARIVAQGLSERWGVSVIVENRSGGNGGVGLMQVARADPDGYTLLAVASSRLTLTSATSRAQVVFDRDFAPITRMGFVPNVVVARGGLPVRDMAGLIVLARTKPGVLSYGSQSIGSNGHLTGELFQQRAGIKLLHIPYKGSAPAVQDLLAGHIDLMFDNLPTVLSPVLSGQLQALAVTTAARSSSLPNVPTVAEAGLQGFDTSAWFALIAPKTTPAEVRTTIERAAIAVLEDPAVRGRLKASGVDAAAEGAESLLRRISEESKMWEELLTKANIKLD